MLLLPLLLAACSVSVGGDANKCNYEESFGNLSVAKRTATEICTGTFIAQPDPRCFAIRDKHGDWAPASAQKGGSLTVTWNDKDKNAQGLIVADSWQFSKC